MKSATGRLACFRFGAASPAHEHISDDGSMKWTFTGEVIEWRGPAPYLFVAMTAEEMTGKVHTQAAKASESTRAVMV